MVVQDRYQTYLDDQREMFDAMVTEDWKTYLSNSWDETRRFEIECLFGRVRPSTVLDIGCGCGFHDREMATYRFVDRVDAIDYSAKSIEKANDVYGHPKVTRWVSDFSKEPPRQQYDLVVSFQVFEHLRNWQEYFQFCRSACAVGGHVAIITPNRLRFSNRLRIYRGLSPELIDRQHFKEYTGSEVTELARQFGFRNESMFGYGLFGHHLVDRLSNRLRLRLGRVLPAIASGLCVILSAPAALQKGRS
jgi:2-polyprenyl-3-methyl-5-hydroxy-6-metoxy-1,4-benzoquinol methylase